VKYLKNLLDIIHNVLDDVCLNLSIGIQTNLLLFNEEIGDLLLERGVSLGISLDGPPDVNNVNRIDHSGRPSSKSLEEKLELLTSKYRPIFSGFLCVIDPDTDPVKIIKYLLSFWSYRNRFSIAIK